jgi:hypothetical protein
MARDHPSGSDLNQSVPTNRVMRHWPYRGSLQISCTSNIERGKRPARRERLTTAAAKP